MYIEVKNMNAQTALLGEVESIDFQEKLNFHKSADANANFDCFIGLLLLHAVYASLYNLCRHCGPIKIYTFLPQVMPHKYSLTPGWVRVNWIHAQNQQ